MKKAFTIIELLMVITILGILLGIVTTVATASIRQSRERRAQAMKQTIQNGIDTYHQQKGKWPGKLETWADNRPEGSTVGFLSNGDYDKVAQDLLKESARKSAKSRVMDPVGLLIMGAGGTDGKSSGVDFRAAATKNGPYAKRMSTSDMTLVYQKKENGKAFRYVIEYNTESDSVTVMTQGDFWTASERLTGAGRSWTGSEVWY